SRPSILDGARLRVLEPFPEAHALLAGGWLDGRLPDGTAEDLPAAIEEVTGARYQALVVAAHPMGDADREAAVRSAVDSVAAVVRGGGTGGYASLVLELAGGTRELVALVRDAAGVRYADPSRAPAASLDELMGSGFAGLVRHVEALVVDGQRAPVPIPGAPRGLHNRLPVPAAYDAALPELDRMAAQVARIAAEIARDAGALERTRASADEAQSGVLAGLSAERVHRLDEARHRLAEAKAATAGARAGGAARFGGPGAGPPAPGPE
ncbi:hypothetical protein K1W54_43090, partial [Micromonospora sp. CPCC 205371]|nr:hypothetical protein [Micromonospora sp. CPCC 205371]